MEILTKENLVGARTALTEISRTFTRSKEKLGFLSKDASFRSKFRKSNQQTWGWGWKNDSDYWHRLLQLFRKWDTSLGDGN